MAMKNSIPARLPRNEVTQILAMSIKVHRRCRNAVIMNYERSGAGNGPWGSFTMTLLVNRSAPLSTIMMSPTGKKQEPIVRMRPGAFS